MAGDKTQFLVLGCLHLQLGLVLLLLPLVKQRCDAELHAGELRQVHTGRGRRILAADIEAHIFKAHKVNIKSNRKMNIVARWVCEF